MAQNTVWTMPVTKMDIYNNSPKMLIVTFCWTEIVLLAFFIIFSWILGGVGRDGMKKSQESWYEGLQSLVITRQAMNSYTSHRTTEKRLVKPLNDDRWCLYLLFYLYLGLARGWWGNFSFHLYNKVGSWLWLCKVVSLLHTWLQITFRYISRHIYFLGIRCCVIASCDCLM